MRAMIFMFFITSLMIMGFLFNSDPTNYGLWIKPINFGLLRGAFLFGFGMSLSVCCATGVLTDLTMGFTRALITLIFFGIGVFLGFPIQRTAGWVTNSWKSCRRCLCSSKSKKA
ncbi:YeeE/YedE thiosulfate transporter family protein [Petrotoga sibirica]|uniref:YeeE/YedE thiosulfate transporter family protein n=2 Tax=Petrotogaceae TaxID=1643949 RepID=UPI0018ECF150